MIWQIKKNVEIDYNYTRPGMFVITKKNLTPFGISKDDCYKLKLSDKNKQHQFLKKINENIDYFLYEAEENIFARFGFIGCTEIFLIEGNLVLIMPSRLTILVFNNNINLKNWKKSEFYNYEPLINKYRRTIAKNKDKNKTQDKIK